MAAAAVGEVNERGPGVNGHRLDRVGGHLVYSSQTGDCFKPVKVTRSCFACPGLPRGQLERDP
jgi:hypothetical protein